MGDIFFFFPIVMVLIVCFVVVPIVARARAERGGQSSPSASQKNKNHGYNREVDSIHITSDAATERRRRLDQLQSLYESGMMEKDEYLERCASVEEDFRGKYRR